VDRKEFLYKQRPLKEKYRSEPGSSRITLRARGSQTDAPISCSVDIGRAVYEAQAHAGVGGPGTAACSGDLLLGALAACAQVTCQMVAEAMGMEAERIEVEVEGDLDLAGTLGVSKDVARGLRAHPDPVRCRRTRSYRGAAGRPAAEDGAVLRSLSDISSAA
jgi:hypothetical protein